MGVSKVVFSGNVVIDLTNDTVTADKLYEGVTAHGADGEAITGTMAGKSDNGIAKQVDANAASVTVSADDFPAGITSIRDYAFYGSQCSSVEIPSTVTHIGRESFSHTSLSDITIPDTVESMDEAAFYKSEKLTACKLPSGLTKIPRACFNGSGLVSMAVPDTVASIGSYAFAYCASITSLSIGSGVTEIPDSMCDSDVSLASVTLPGTITAIGSGAFQSCAKLTAITLPLGLKTIGVFAFNGSGLTSLDVPASVASIGFRAIEGGIPVTVRATTPPSITSSTFVSTPSHIYVPASAVDTYKAATGWSDYSSIIEAITE